tara:strand:- start:4203 stop:4343 length:141 start_codon:yes stop_codon:yes gene_type:complete
MGKYGPVALVGILQSLRLASLVNFLDVMVLWLFRWLGDLCVVVGLF